MSTPSPSQRAPEESSRDVASLITEADPLRWLTEHWDRSRLGDPSGMLALSSVMRLREHVIAAVGRELATLGLTTTGYLLLMTVMLSEDGSRPLSRIAKAMLVHPTTVTQTVDRLEREQLVERIPHPTDRRTMLARLTSRGETKCVAATDALRTIGFGLPTASVQTCHDLVRVLTPFRLAAGDEHPPLSSAV